MDARFLDQLLQYAMIQIIIWGLKLKCKYVLEVKEKRCFISVLYVYNSEDVYTLRSAITCLACT